MHLTVDFRNEKDAMEPPFPVKQKYYNFSETLAARPVKKAAGF